MDRNDFVKLSTATLERLEEQLADLEHDDLDVELAADVLTLCFTDGTRFVINSHSAAGQIWMAANKSAWHFDHNPTANQWIAAKSGDELGRTLARVVGEKLGTEIVL